MVAGKTYARHPPRGVRRARGDFQQGLIRFDAPLEAHKAVIYSSKYKMIGAILRHPPNCPRNGTIPK
jgi:hypothetical protein